MYFLAHYYLRQSESSGFCFGNLLPDLVQGFTKVYNQKIVKSTASLSEEEIHFHDGIITHYADDRKFHLSDAFVKVSDMLTKGMVHAQLDRGRLRLSVIAHLLAEILFDRCLQECHPSLTQNFYNMLENTLSLSLKHYFEKHQIASLYEVVCERRERMLQNRFLYQLNDSKVITDIISFLYAKITGINMTNSELFRIIEVINQYYKSVKEWKNLLDDL
ncbi:MAG: hypothetical protein RMJ53_00090 [Chitinophagales bacterium]|nr:hypothetical protein [Chitinophagales bacterium]MDW8272612.1 hypothetical protein [Chitinophagales bacterium]